MKKKIMIGVILFLFVGLPVLAIWPGIDLVAGQIANQVEGEYFDSDGVRLHYTDQGNPEGEAVIFVHGFAANQDVNWRLPGFYSILEEDYRVIGLDVRGHGLSERVHGIENYGMNMVDDIARLMDHLAIDKAHVVGYSMGGFITMAFIGKYPERLITATVGGAGYYSQDEYDTLPLLKIVGPGLRNGEGFYPIAIYFEGDSLAGKFRAYYSNEIMLRINDATAMADCFDSLVNLEGPSERMASNVIPILNVMGTDDPLRKAAENMEEKMANCEMLWLDGANHMSAVAKSEFRNHLKDFLTEHPLEDAENKITTIDAAVQETGQTLQ